MIQVHLFYLKKNFYFSTGNGTGNGRPGEQELDICNNRLVRKSHRAMKTALSQGRSFGVIKLPTHGLLSGSRQSRERPDCAAVCELEIIHGVHGVRDSADP